MNTLFDKIWDKHVVQQVEDGPTQLYIDRLYCHEVTSPQAFDGMRARGLKCFRPEKIYCMPDHNTPTHDQDKPIEDPVSKTQVDTLAKNAKEFGLTHYGMMSKDNGIIHVVGPEKGLSLPGMTIVCGDSHTSTHGAMGAVAFGIGTSEVEMVMASQCILQQKPKSMRISINGQLQKGVTAKDVVNYLVRNYNSKKPKTYNSHYYYLRTFFNWCTKDEQKFISENPIKNVKPKEEPWEEPRYMKPEDVARLFKVLEAERDEHPEYLAQAIVGFFCGTRACEIRRMAMVEDAAKRAGFSHKGFHQTGADFTSFSTKNEVAGQFDDETPTGIFIKPTDEDIGLQSETKQMPLYFKADNMLEFANREEIRKYWIENVQG